MFKIGVIGGRETVMGFKALGLDVYPVESAEEARHTLREITGDSDEYAILYVEENLAERKRLYTDEGKQYYSGNLWVPDDLDQISLW